MPLIEREQFESILNKLNNPEIDHAERTDLLQELRVAQSTAYVEHEDFTTKLNRLEKDNNDLVLSNSKLFRQLGTVEPEQKQQEEQKEFSETVTIEQFEKGI